MSTPGTRIGCGGRTGGTVSYSQLFLLNFCLIKSEWDIHVYNYENWLFSTGDSLSGLRISAAGKQ